MVWLRLAGLASTSDQCLHARTFTFPVPRPCEWIQLREVEPFCLVAVQLITVLLHLSLANRTSTGRLMAFYALKNACFCPRFIHRLNSTS
ncbi:MAG: hypothetical protein ACFFD4_14280 [Candidatus Odinarchaeota archaeon]